MNYLTLAREVCIGLVRSVGRFGEGSGGYGLMDIKNFFFCSSSRFAD